MRGPQILITSPDATSPSIAAWPGAHVTIQDPDFDFVHLLKTSIAKNDIHEGIVENGNLDEHLFSLSPLSTPPSSPTDHVSSFSTPSSPVLGSTDLRGASAIVLEDTECLNVNVTTTIVESDIAGASGPLTGRAKAKQRTKRRSKEARKAQRIDDRKAIYGGNYHARPTPMKKYVINAKPIITKFNMSSAKVASTGFEGLDDRKGSKKKYKLEDLVGEGSLGFKLIAWDGITPTPILAGEQLIAVLAGKPGDKTWPSREQEATDLLAWAQEKCRVTKDEQDHRRGTFMNLRSGVSHGSGQHKPSNSRPKNKTNTAILKRLNESDPFISLAGFASSVMATWTPELYHHYQTHLGALFAHDPTLKRNFATSIFTANTFNLGPRTVCFKHTDSRNLSYGFCAVTAFGSFDPTKGGHLVLWQCKLVIEFPPGSTILIPSAVIAHFNVDVGVNETRYSFTQYSAGSLFKWVEHGFQTRTAYRSSLTHEEREEQDAKDAERWKYGLAFFPIMKTTPSTT